MIVKILEMGTSLWRYDRFYEFDQNYTKKTQPDEIYYLAAMSECQS